jgi:hypothetical protein
MVRKLVTAPYMTQKTVFPYNFFGVRWWAASRKYDLLHSSHQSVLGKAHKLN